jgi:hypothetical protein
MNDVLNTAKSCRHYAMCKIDFLGSGICASGPVKQYVSFYPQGRMDLYAALVEKRVPLTDRCIEIADSCDLCGLCDYQCYFVTEMRPSRVMAALKQYVAELISNGGTTENIPADDNLVEIRKIVGDYWATNDRAIAVTYSHDPCPIAAPKMPDYVVMPNSMEEISALMKLFRTKNIPFAVRGNGSSVMGFVMSEGAVIDLNRMKTIEFDEENWLVKVGPGVAAFDLQVEAQKRGYRVNVAEPSALVCANIMCSGIFSTFSYSYGTAANNYIDAEFVANDGSIFTLNDKDAPNLFSYHKMDSAIPGICTSVSVKLHPMTNDEGAILVPFESLEEALNFSKECALRRIGLAMGILGGEYFSTFLAPTKKLAEDLKDVFTKKLGIAYLVMIVGDKYVLKTIKDMGYPIFDQNMFRTLCLGMPSLKSAPWLDLLKELSDEEPFSYLLLSHFADLAETALAPSPAQITQDIDPELKLFFEKIYAKPEMTNLVWLTMFRIISSRMGREKHVVAFIIYLPIENELIASINGDFKRIGDKFNVKNDYGFITPLDNGKRCVFEFDYYLNQNDPDEIGRMQQAMYEAGMMIEGYSAKYPAVKWIRYTLYQGFCRMENLLYT